MDRMRGPDGLRARLRQAERADLAGRDERGHRADGLLDRNVGVEAMLVEQVDHIDAEPLQRCVRHRAHVFRPAVEAGCADRERRASTPIVVGGIFPRCRPEPQRDDFRNGCRRTGQRRHEGVETLGTHPDQRGLHDDLLRGAYGGVKHEIRSRPSTQTDRAVTSRNRTSTLSRNSSRRSANGQSGVGKRLIGNLASGGWDSLRPDLAANACRLRRAPSSDSLTFHDMFDICSKM